MSAAANATAFPKRLVDLNVGGRIFTTTAGTLMREADSALARALSPMLADAPASAQAGSAPHVDGEATSRLQVLRDREGRLFLDRDPTLFSLVLDYLRNGSLVLPQSFHERERLKSEAALFELHGLLRQLTPRSPSITPQQQAVASGAARGGAQAVITMGYRATLASGKDGLSELKFRKLGKILVCGRLAMCREVFGDTLNESRDATGSHGDADTRYSARLFLTHTCLELAVEKLYEAGFELTSAQTAAPNSCVEREVKPGTDSEESRWLSAAWFTFVRK